MNTKHTIILTIVVALSTACSTSQPAAENQNSAPANSSITVKNSALEKTLPAAAPSSSPAPAITSRDSGVPPAGKEQGKTTGGLSDAAANFDKIKPGMSYAEVAQILGSGGEKAGEFKIQNGLMAMYRWKGRSEKGEWILSAQFENGKLSNKSQFGLK